MKLMFSRKCLVCSNEKFIASKFCTNIITMILKCPFNANISIIVFKSIIKDYVRILVMIYFNKGKLNKCLSYQL